MPISLVHNPEEEPANGPCRGHQWTFTLKMDKKDLEARTGLQVVQLDEDLRALSKKRVSDSFQNGLTYQYFDNAVQAEAWRLVPWLNGGLVCKLHNGNAKMAKIAKNATFLAKFEG